MRVTGREIALYNYTEAQDAIENKLKTLNHVKKVIMHRTHEEWYYKELKCECVKPERAPE